MIKLYIKEIEVELEEDNIIKSFIILKPGEYKKEKDKTDFQQVETDLTYKVATAYPEYLVVENKILTLENVEEIKNYTYRIFMLENQKNIGTNLLRPGYYPIEQINEMVSFTVEKEIDIHDVTILQNQYIVVKDKTISLKKDTTEIFKIVKTNNLLEEKEYEKIRFR